ncbi:hypothetical protein, conserved [Eimeria maxima]|uniref:Uncharacterized protein n=1 Tax=Eimeria maxima TaxID=5804 RepID=U6M366_EIMMA|nr:hypothetical protein, conserved [Eimeria maxima]CDJ58466.1 hypothetical protein, conserved [Eimeria maxima]
MRQYASLNNCIYGHWHSQGPVGEGKFSTPIEVIVPHEDQSVTVAFGSTIETDDPYDQSWGVSAVEIAVR